MLLPWLILIPFIGGLLCWQTKNFGVKTARWVALITTGLTLALSLLLWINGNYFLIHQIDFLQWQYKFITPWITRFGINIHLAIDGLSLLMVMLTSLIGILAVLCSWCEIEKSQAFFYMHLMWILSGITGIFLAVDMLLFFFFWEIVPIPMYFLITLWGCSTSNIKKRTTAAVRLFMHTQVSGLVMLVSILALTFFHYKTTGIWTFNYEDLLTISMPYNMEYLIMLGFFIAFAVKMPLVPLHSWLADAHAQAPTAGSVDIAGILMKTSVYGMLRFLLPLFPNASKEFAPIAISLGIISMFYGSWMAFIQFNIKRLIAYASVSHMGLLLVALYTGSTLAYQGVVIQMITHSLSTAGLFIISGQFYERLNTFDMHTMGNLWIKIKWLPAFSIFFLSAIMGIPGTGNFIGEFMILFGSYKVLPITTIVSAFSIVFNSIYSLVMLKRICFSKIDSILIINREKLLNISLREKLIILLLVVLLILIGFYPQPIIDISYSTINNIRKWFVHSVLTTTKLHNL